MATALSAAMRHENIEPIFIVVRVQCAICLKIAKPYQERHTQGIEGEKGRVTPSCSAGLGRVISSPLGFMQNLAK